MKFYKKVFLGITILTVIVLLYRASIYRQLFSYQSIGQRTSYPAVSNELIKYIDVNFDYKKDIDIEYIIESSLLLSSKKIHFTTTKNHSDPNKLIHSKSANCIGYAAFYTTTCNYLLKKNKLDNDWIAKAQVGKIHLLGYDIHLLFDSPFFKDHDFVTIEHKKSGKTFAVDPTVNDYLFIDYIAATKN